MKFINRIIAVLTRKQKLQACFLLVLIVIGTILEMLGVGLIVPLLVVMVESDPVAKYPFLKPVYDFLGNPSQTQMIVMGLTGFVLVYLLKVIFLAYLLWEKTVFLNSLREYFTNVLFSGYLKQPYSYHLQINSSLLYRNVTTDVVAHNKSILSLITIVIDGLILIGVSLLFLIAEPVASLLVMTFLVSSSVLFHRITKNKIVRWGVARRELNGKVIQQFRQSFGAVKEIILLGRHSGFEKDFYYYNKNIRSIENRQKMVAGLPKLWFDVMVSLGLTGLIIGMLYIGRKPSELVPIMGLFAVGAFKIMPSLVRIMQALQELKFNKYSAEKFCDDLDMFSQLSATSEFNKNDSSTKKLNWEKLQLISINFNYPNSDFRALNDVAMVIPRNTHVGIIGGSGAGKSTLIDIILGLLEPKSGHVMADDIDIRHNLRLWQQQIGYVPQSIYLSDDTIRRNIALGVMDKKIDESAVERALQAAQLDGFLASLPDGLETMIGENGVRLSGGQRQRIGIARALYHDPTVLVLDEATSALDSETERDVMKAVNALHGQKTVIIVAHRMSTVAACNLIVKLEDGRVVDQGTFSEVVDHIETPDPSIIQKGESYA